MRRLRIAFLSQRVPFPPTRGDKIITFRMVERLQRRHDVTCVAFSHTEDDEQGARALRDRGVPVTTVPYRPFSAKAKGAAALLGREPLTTAMLGSPSMRDAVAAAMRRADLAVAFSSSMGVYLLDYPSVPRILHFCELDSDKWQQYALRTRPPMKWIYAREARTLLRVERQLAAAMNTSLVCTPLEANIFRARIVEGDCRVLQNGIDLEYFSPSGLDPVRNEMVFTGVMNYFPNVEGCAWFAQHVLPRIAAAEPDAHFTIVGASPTRAVMKLAEDVRITVTGRVPDTRPYVRRASVVVAPLRIARGIQNKVLEGLAMGLPVVGTTAATQGVGGVPGRDYLVADEPEAMSAAIIGLLRNDPERRALASCGRAFVEGRYVWDRAMDPLEQLVDQLTAKP
jgi:sugar transferase (PEP-CTERM/EpsH1 system associated)